MDDVPVGSLAAALEREHRDIDVAIELFTERLAAGEVDAEPLLRAAAALRRHIYLEEQFLFPPLQEAGMVAPVFVMLREHGQLWRTLDALQVELRLTADPHLLQKLAKELVVQLGHHNPKEERVIYPQADQVLNGEASARLQTFVEAGELPAGWACERA